MSIYPEADRLMQEAAARGELPIIDHLNRHLFGLKQLQRRTRGNGWLAWWVASKGASGITNPDTRFCIATEDLAPDEQTWPTHWALETITGVTAGFELKALNTARHFDTERQNYGFELLSPVLGWHKPVLVRCRCCGVKRKHQHAVGLINNRLQPNRCFAQNNRGNPSATLARKRAISLNADLLSRGIFRQCNPADYVNNKTPIWFSCDCAEGGHIQLPLDVLRGCRTCQSSRQYKMANGKPHAELTTALMTNPLAVAAIRINGTATDAPWRVLTGQQELSNNETEIYLFQTAVAGVRNFGISYDTVARAKSHHPDNVVALLGKREYPDRDTAVLIEAAFKYQHACPDVPPGLEGCGNTTEYTLLRDGDFWQEIDLLEESLRDLGPVEFVRNYCHPWQIQKAESEGILPALKGAA